MEYNEPLNLSIKKKPIAVVIPSSSSNKDDANERLDTTSPTGLNESDDTNRSSPSVTVAEETSLCNNAEVVKRSKSPIKLTSDATNDADESTDSSAHNLNLVDLLYGSSAVAARPFFDSDLLDFSQRRSTVGASTDGSLARSPSLGASTYSSSAAAVTSISPTAQSHSQQTTASTLTTSIADATNTLTNYLNQQQSLDIAKMHLERYLKVTNQYLHATLDGTNLTSNEQINHLIRTNILTNKIAANNLISIINKLLEQNIISEYYFKHASRLMMQSYENSNASATTTPSTTATATVANFGDSNAANDKDPYDIFDKSKLSPAASLSPLPMTNVSHHQSELLKELVKQRHFRNSDALTQQDDDGDASDTETSDNKPELLDYDDTIKKETIPVHANPFMSYLHMHLNRSLDKGKTNAKYFNGTTIAIPNSVSPTDSLSQPSPTAIESINNNLRKPLDGKTKSHKKRSSHQSNSNTTNIFNNNNNSHTKSSSRSSSYDLALNLSQRLLSLFKLLSFDHFCVHWFVCSLSLLFDSILFLSYLIYYCHIIFRLRVFL